MHRLRTMWINYGISIKTKKRVMERMACGVAAYGCES